MVVAAAAVVVRGRGNEARKRRHSARAALPGLEKAMDRMESGRRRRHDRGDLRIIGLVQEVAHVASNRPKSFPVLRPLRVSVHGSRVAGVQRGAEVRSIAGGWASQSNGQTRPLPDRGETTGHERTAEALGSLVLSGGRIPLQVKPQKTDKIP